VSRLKVEEYERSNSDLFLSIVLKELSECPAGVYHAQIVSSGRAKYGEQGRTSAGFSLWRVRGCAEHSYPADALRTTANGFHLLRHVAVAPAACEPDFELSHVDALPPARCSSRGHEPRPAPFYPHRGRRLPGPGGGAADVLLGGDALGGFQVLTVRT
jgi:hypothetical protein